MQRFVFVLEQTLGHVAHSRNLTRALGRRTDIEATVIPVPFPPSDRLQTLPGLRNWSLRASRVARAGLGRRLAQGPVDAVFIHTQVAAFLASRIMHRVPTVVSLDATPVNFDAVGEAYGHARQPWLVESVKRSVTRHALMPAAALVTWCDWAKRSLVDDYGFPAGRIHTIHPGVDLDLFVPPSGTRRSGPIRLLFVGGDFARKGGPELLEALAELRGEVEADIVTPQQPTAPAGARFRHHAGLQPQSPALLELYRNADVFVLPARGDCFPQAIAEAMACGLPVISSAVGAIDEMIHDGANGFLVRPGSTTDLVRAVRTLAGDPSLRRRMGEAGQRLARSRHDAIANANRIFDLLSAVATGERATDPGRSAVPSKA